MSDIAIMAASFFGSVSAGYVIGAYGGENGWSWGRVFIGATIPICLFALLAEAAR